MILCCAMANASLASGGSPGLRGRSDECARLDGIVAAVREGHSRTLLLRGEAGVGKTALLDYAQWLDRASARTLAFVGRRLLADPVGLVFAAREPGEELRGLAELEVKGLRDGDARALLRSAVGSLLDEGVRDRVVAETRG